MTSRRVLKAAEAIREVVGMAILTDIKDPRVRDVTVTFVEVSPDMRQAKVHVSVMGDETKQNLSLRGLQNSAGFFQHKVSKRIDMRYTPQIQFVLDQGVKHSILVAQMLSELLPKNETLPAENEAAAEDEDDTADLDIADLDTADVEAQTKTNLDAVAPADDNPIQNSDH